MRYASLQYLRAAAVISVLILHSHLLFDAPLLTLPLLSDFGWLGVRLFFVISGFIVADRIGTCSNLADYLIRRVVRVFPLYFLVGSFAAAFAVIAGGHIFLLPRTDSGLPFDPHWPSYLLMSLFMVPQDAWPIFAVGWSLEFEVVFYGLFGLAYFALGPRAAAPIVLAFAVAGLCGVLPGSHVAHPFMLYFFAGCLCREAFRASPDTAYRSALVVLVPATVLWVAHLYGLLDLGNGGFVLASTASFASLLLVSLTWEPVFAGAVWGRWIVRIGDASFSIYLGHWLVFCLLRPLTVELSGQAWILEALRWGIVAGAVALSIAVHRKIELPVNRAVLHRVGRLRARVAPNRARTQEG
ncbi:MAG: acyltransferase [Pseudomonadota bacterium]